MLVLKLKILRTHTYTDGWKERLCPAKFSLSFSFFFFFHLKVKKKSFYRSSKFINTQTTKTAPQPTRRTFFSRPPSHRKITNNFSAYLQPSRSGSPPPPPPLQAFLTEVNDYDLTGETDDLTASGY